MSRSVSMSDPAPAPVTERTVAQGTVLGFIADSGAHVWRGLPFAASTAGANRWRAPQPPPAWQGTREALTFASRCAQLTTEFDRKDGLRPGLLVGSEDCLALDIYAPPDAEGARLPVMMWIHGGFNVWGRSSAYDASRLAVNEGVIVVAVQYRLGPLGWFSHPALRASASTPEGASACFATLDLIAGLRWIRDNIAAFGGDAGNVSIFGESAGGHNVVTLLASPLASGLFHRAIVQSGSFDSVSVAEAAGDEGDLVNSSGRIAGKLNATTADALRAVSVGELFAAYSIDGGFLDLPRVIQDGVVLPEGPLRDAFASIETFNVVPIMTGTNRDEMKLFYLRNDKVTRKILGLFVVARDQDFYDALTYYIGRVWRIRAVDEPAAMMHGAGHAAVYAYRFDWDDGGRLLLMDFHKLLGAAHGFEIPFVFNNFHHLGDADRFLFQKKTLQDREHLSHVIGGYWASFARDGVPTCSGAPAWPHWADRGGSVMRLDAGDDEGIEVMTGADSLDALATDINADPRLDDSGRRMFIDEMGNWMFTRPVRAILAAAVNRR